jgi:hypothetical protein
VGIYRMPVFPYTGFISTPHNKRGGADASGTVSAGTKPDSSKI